jgi:hypothetical protein
MFALPFFLHHFFSFCYIDTLYYNVAWQHDLVAEEFRVPTSIGTHAKLYVVNSIFLNVQMLILLEVPLQ